MSSTAVSMLRHLEFKPDFDKTVARFEAWWKGQVVDRPPVSLWAMSDKKHAKSIPTKTHASERERWFDMDYQIERAITSLEQGNHLGDSLPVYYPNLGPELTATLYGCELEFSRNSSWSRPVIHDPEEWSRIATAEPNFDQPYWRWIEEATRRAVAESRGRFLVGIADLHGNYDILAALRDPQTLCMDLLDCPDAVLAAGRQVTRGYTESFDRLYQIVSAAGMGSTTWTQVYHQGRAYLPNCDFWCMVSHDIAREMVLPDISTEIDACDRNLFHLDGPAALRHLDLLLDLPRLDAVQWIYGDGHGSAADWIPVYQRIRAAGKSVQVVAKDGDDALAIIRAVGPEGLWFTIGNPFASDEEAEAFLREVARTRRE